MSPSNKVVKLTVFPSLLSVLNRTHGLLQNCNLQRRYVSIRFSAGEMDEK